VTESSPSLLKCFTPESFGEKIFWAVLFSFANAGLVIFLIGGHLDNPASTWMVVNFAAYSLCWIGKVADFLDRTYGLSVFVEDPMSRLLFWTVFLFANGVFILLLDVAGFDFDINFGYITGSR